MSIDLINGLSGGANGLAYPMLRLHTLNIVRCQHDSDVVVASPQGLTRHCRCWSSPVWEARHA